MELKMDPYIVFVRFDDANLITAVNSSAFLLDPDGWMEIDRGYTQRHHHAQGNYFPKPLMDERGICRYRSYPIADAPSREVIARYIKDGVEYVILERTASEMDADYAARPAPEPTTEELLLETAADHEYRICLMELGVSEDDL